MGIYFYNSHIVARLGLHAGCRHGMDASDKEHGLINHLGDVFFLSAYREGAAWVLAFSGTHDSVGVSESAYRSCNHLKTHHTRTFFNPLPLLEMCYIQFPAYVPHASQFLCAKDML